MGVAIQAFGWVGTVFILYAFLANSQGWMRPGPAYFALNLVGSIAIMLVAWRQAAWQPFAINAFWAAVAAYSLVVFRLRGDRPVQSVR